MRVMKDNLWHKLRFCRLVWTLLLGQTAEYSISGHNKKKPILALLNVVG